MPFFSYAQIVPERTSPPDTVRSERIHIDHADYLRGAIVGGREYIYLRGNIELSQDSIFMYCDSARIIDKRELAAYGNVIIQKGDSLEVHADTLLYFADTRLADLLGEVALIHGEKQIWTTHMTYDLDRDLAYYDRSAVLLDTETQLASRRGFYWVRTDEALFIDSVVVINPEFSLLTDSLRYHTATQIAYFIAPTWIFQEGAEIYCEAGHYDVLNQTAVFRQNARYRNDNQHAWAEKITYDGELRIVTLIDTLQQAHYAEDDILIRGDTIIYEELTGDTRISGRAVFMDSTRTMQSDVIMYNRNTEQLSTLGRAQLTDGSQTLRADAMDFDQQKGLGFARGNVVLIDTAAQMRLESDFGEFVREYGFIKAYGAYRPVLKTIVDNDTLYLTADTLISMEVIDSLSGDTVRQFTGFEDVRMLRGTMQGLCDLVFFDGRDSIIRMFGTPVLWSDTTQFIADTIFMHIAGSAVSKVVLRHNALIISSVIDLFYNQIKGRHIIAGIEDNEVRDMHVTGNAESIYYAQDEEHAFIGVNRVVSSEIFFTFADSRIDRIRFVTKPEGKMLPMHQVEHEQMRLEGFVWKEALRPRSLADLF